MYRVIHTVLPVGLAVAAGLILKVGMAPAQGPATPANPLPPPAFLQPAQKTEITSRATAPPASYGMPAVNPLLYGSAPPPAGYGYWPGYSNPYGGGLSGAADAINAQGEFEKHFQQSRLLNQEVERSKIDTHRKKVEQWLWERAVLPTPEDERRRAQYEQLRRSLNDPPPAEIWNAAALNNILTAIQKVQSPGRPGPVIPIYSEHLANINLTTGTTASTAGVLRNGPKLRWPLVLQDDAFDASRKRVEDLTREAVDQVSTGDVPGKVLRSLYKEVDAMEASLKSRIEDLTPTESVQGRRYLRELRDSIKVLEQPDAQNYFNGRRSAQGNTVGELVQNMTAQGLKFAPAVSGGEASYTALHRAMVAYFSVISQPTIR